MPDVNNNAEENEQTELEIEAEEIEYCGTCDNREDDCSCRTCENCSDRFIEGTRGACDSCNLCRACLDRGGIFHYHCGQCGESASEDSQTCPECGRADCCAPFEYDSDDGNENYLCNRCWRESSEYQDRQRNDVIESYSNRNYPPFMPEKNEENKYNLYLGVELEVECPDTEPCDSAAAVDSVVNQPARRILFKEDGSLDNGYEMVTGPMTLAYHQELWPVACATAVKSGARSWKHRTTGTHVHLSRSFFRSSSHLARFVVFINSENHRQQIVKLAGRTSESYAKLKKKFLSTASDCGDDRYEAVNLQNDRTVEVRIFKGTLKKERVLAYVEFCDSVARYTKTVGTEENWSGYLEFLSETGAYPHVSAFFNRTIPMNSIGLPVSQVEDEELVSA